MKVSSTMADTQQAVYFFPEAKVLVHGLVHLCSEAEVWGHSVSFQVQQGKRNRDKVIFTFLFFFIIDYWGQQDLKFTGQNFVNYLNYLNIIKPLILYF